MECKSLLENEALLYVTIHTGILILFVMWMYKRTYTPLLGPTGVLNYESVTHLPVFFWTREHYT